jgi:hypothetical protein
MGKVLHASYSGWFPFCVEKINYPTLVYSESKLDEIMKIFWRIRKIKFYGTYFDGDDIESPWDFETVSAADKEEGLVCNPGWLSTSGLNTFNVGFGINNVFYENIEEDRFVLDSTIFGNLENPSVEEQAITFNSIAEPTETQPALDFEGIIFRINNPFLLVGTINYEILEYWSYDGIYDTTTGLPL